MSKKKDINKIHEKKLKHGLTMTSSEKDLEEISATVAKSHRKKLLVAGIILAVIVAACGAVLLLYRIDIEKQYSGYVVVKDNLTGASYCRVLGNSTLHFSQNGVYASDSEGNSIWDQGFSMSNPTYASSSAYGIIYDRENTSVALFTESGLTATYALSQKIVAAGVSDYGVGAFMTQSGTASSVIFYDKTGRKLDIEVKNVLAESSGYPISMALSPSGNGLVLSLTYLDQGSMRTRISFMNFDVGKDISDRVVGFYEYGDHLFPEVDYISASAVVAFGDDRAVFYSLENEASPVVSKEITYEEEISAVMAGDGKAAVILKSESGGNQLIVYDETGEETLRYKFDFEFTNGEISGDYILIYGGETTLITSSTQVKYCGKFDGVVTSMVTVGRRTFLQYGAFGSRIVELD